MATKRPASLIVFGILNLIFGLWGLLAGLLTLVTIVLSPNLLGTSGPDFDFRGRIGELLPWFGNYEIVMGVMGFVASSVAIAAGIGLMQAREWARKATIGYGIYKIAVVLIGGWITIRYVLPATEEVMGSISGFPDEFSKWNTAIASGGLCLGLIYPVLILIFMNRQVVKDATAGDAGVEDQLE